MEQVITGNTANTARRARRAHPRVRPGILRRPLRRGLLAALQGLLAVFVAGYPFLRLGLLGPVPEGHALEAAGGVVAGMLALALFVLEGDEP